MHVRDATFVVTDTETTGTSAASNRIIELAAVKVRGGEVVDRFQQLVNPGRSIPKRITRLTSITTGMVFDAPPIEEVLPAYLDFLGEGVFTAHNLSFDRGFVNAELKRTGRAPLENDMLCTLRLARRLLPGLRSKGLSRLIQFYDLQVSSRHRALGDAKATTTVLQQFLSQLDFEHEITTLDELLTFQHKSYQSVRRVPPHIRTLRENALPELPDAPGVYFMKRANGTILYIGKAKRLSDRVRSYFNAIESHATRRRKLMSKVREVTWTTTETELGALMLESRLIKKHKPTYNRAQRRYRSRPFVRLDTTEDYPRLSWRYTLEDDGAEYYGPLRNREQAERVIDIASRFFQLRECDDGQFHLGQRCLYADMDRCTAPCETDDAGRYATEIDRVRAFLMGQDRSVLEQIEARMQQAAENLEFEQAAEFRDGLEQLERMYDRQRTVAAPVLEHNAVLLAPDGDHEAEVVLVRYGRPVCTLRCQMPLADADPERLQESFATHFTPARVRPDTLTKRDVDEIRLLAHWTYKRRDDLVQVRWSAGTAPEALLERIRAIMSGVHEEAA